MRRFNGPTIPWDEGTLTLPPGFPTFMSLNGVRLVPAADAMPITPDLLRWENIGAADGMRGRLVRGFFWLLRAWPPRIAA